MPKGGSIEDCLDAYDIDALLLGSIIKDRYVSALTFFQFREMIITADEMRRQIDLALRNTTTHDSWAALPIHIRRHWLLAIVRRTHNSSETRDTGS